MPLTTETLDLWFTYHPPTEETRRLYAAIRDAEEVMHTTMLYVVGTARRHEGAMGDVLGLLFGQVNAAARAFAVAIDTAAPESADKTAALRCVRLARNAANEAIVSARAEQSGSPVRVWASSQTLLNIAHAEIVKARWQANSAIAICHAASPLTIRKMETRLPLVLEVPDDPVKTAEIDPTADPDWLKDLKEQSKPDPHPEPESFTLSGVSEIADPHPEPLTLPGTGLVLDTPGVPTPSPVPPRTPGRRR